MEIVKLAMQFLLIAYTDIDQIYYNQFFSIVDAGAT